MEIKIKKILSIILIVAFCFFITNYSFAAGEYSFELQYTGTIEKNVEKDANVLLIGNSGTLYSKVRIKIDITGPATPKIIAKDTSNIEHDIAQIGYWGPQEGFAVQGDFTNTTPIRATFTEEGEYTIKLSLINLENSNSVITEETFNITVVSNDTTTENNTTTNTVTNTVTDNNNVIEELPKTGKSIWEYITYIAIIAVVFGSLGIYMLKKEY